MENWGDCCRTCMSEESLSPIFFMPEHHDKYTDIIFITTGIKVEINDNLPQYMCPTCIDFINNSYKFRKKCETTQKTLLDTYNSKTFNLNIKSTYTHSCIDISDFVNDSDSHNDDNNDYVDSNNKIEIEIQTADPFIAENNIKITKKGKRTKSNIEKGVKKSLGTKKKSGEKKERQKEEIECEYCHKILTSRLSLRNHYKIHTGFDVVCEHCGKKFITRRLLLMHCRAKHGYEKTDKCSYCDYTASNTEQVKIHERLHTGEKPYVCAQCGAGFHRKSSYLQHVPIHLPDKNVQCEQCPARFKSVTLMRIHANRHRAPQYTFKCRVCENNFARRRNVLRHLQRVHGLSPDAHLMDRLKLT